MLEDTPGFTRAMWKTLPFPQGFLWMKSGRGRVWPGMSWGVYQDPSPSLLLCLLPVLFHCLNLLAPSLGVPEKNEMYLGVMPADRALRDGSARAPFSWNARLPISVTEGTRSQGSRSHIKKLQGLAIVPRPSQDTKAVLYFVHWGYPSLRVPRDIHIPQLMSKLLPTNDTSHRVGQISSHG